MKKTPFKYRSKRWLFLLLVPCGLFMTRLLAVRDIQRMSDYPLLLGAHRGSSNDFMENTLPAFADAVQNPRFSFIEFDIRYTQDRKIVVFHDRSLMRFGKSLHRIHELTYTELAELVEFHIPTYEEVMDLVGGVKRLNIEIKTCGDDQADRDLIDYVIADCQRRGILDEIVISSSSKDLVRYLTKTYPDMPTGLVCWVHPTLTFLESERIVEKFYDRVEELGVEYVMLHGVNLHNYELLTRLKPATVKIVFWYFNEQMFLVQKDPTDHLW